MKTEERIKRIQWLLIASLLVAIFARFSLEQLEFKMFEFHEFEEQLVGEVFKGGIKLKELGFHSIYNNDTTEKTNAFIKLIKSQYSSSSTATQMADSLSGYSNLNWSIDVDKYTDLDGTIYFLNDDIDPDKSLILTDSKISKATVLLTGKYIREFLIFGICDVQINNSKNDGKIEFYPKNMEIFIKNHDNYLSSIDFLENTDRITLDLNGHIEDLKSMSTEGIQLPLINAKVSVLEAGIGIILVTVFIQVYSLSTVRSLSTKKECLDGWLFVSWIYCKRGNIIDKLTCIIEAATGVTAYLSLSVWLPYSIWTAIHMQFLISGEEGNLLYLNLVPSLIISVLFLYYLIRILISIFKERTNGKALEEEK